MYSMMYSTMYSAMYSMMYSMMYLMMYAMMYSMMFQWCTHVFNDVFNDGNLQILFQRTMRIAWGIPSDSRPNMVPNACQMEPGGVRGRPRDDPWSGSEKRGATGLRKRWPFGTTWATLGTILDPAGRQGGSKIELFGTKSHQNLKKWGPEWGIKKYMNI